MNDTRVASGGASLKTRSAGSGNPTALVFLHAGVADSRMWLPQLEAFAPRFHVVAYDRRGFGETTCSDEAFRHTDDLAAVLDELGLERAVLVGCSQGGRIAVDFALEKPGRVVALVLVSSALSGAPEPSEFPSPIDEFVAEWEAVEERGDVGEVNRFEARAWLDGPTQTEGRVGGERRDLFLSMNGTALKNDAESPLTQTIEPASAVERLIEITVPTLIVSGALDFFFTLETAAILANSIPNARSMMMAGVAHLPPLESSDVFNQALAEFLQTLPS